MDRNLSALNELACEQCARQENVHDFAAAYWDNWIAPVESQRVHATGKRKAELAREVERLKSARQAEIVARFGKMP